MISGVRNVSTDQVEGCFIVGIAEDEQGQGRCLIFQEPVDAAIVGDVDTYCITDDRNAVAYGGVTSVSIDGDRLTLEFTVEASAELLLPTRLELVLHLSRADVSRLARALRRVLTYGNPTNRPSLHLGVEE